jgi:hypothetical protein
MSGAGDDGPVNPMVPLVMGWLWGTLDGPGRQDFSIRTVRPLGTDGLVVTFASGLQLRVRVEEVPAGERL